MFMSQYHLYLLQCSFDRIDSAMQELSQVCLENDIIVLMDDSIFALQHPLLQVFSRIKILGNPHNLIDQSGIFNHQHTIDIINYDDLTDLIHASQKTHSWR